MGAWSLDIVILIFAFFILSSNLLKNTRDSFPAQDIGVDLMQLTIDPRDKEMKTKLRKKMAASNSRRRKKSKLKRCAIVSFTLVNIKTNNYM